MSILEIHGLNVRFRVRDEMFHAVKDFDLVMERGDRVALVGESGSGKSVIASAIFGILERNAEREGTI